MSAIGVDALILGASGPIGRAIGRRAQEHGIEVLLTSRGSATMPLDAMDTGGVHELLVARDVRVVVDLSNPETAGPRSTMSAVIDSLAATRVARIVYASSAAVYGDEGDRPFSEADPLRGTSNYAMSKVRAERDLGMRAPMLGLTSAALRIFNVYGPGCARSLANRLVDGPAPALAMSADFIRDYVHVDDVADALLTAIKSDVSGVFNVATGVGISNLDLAGAVEPAAFEPSDPVTSYSVGDPSAIREGLGWQARRSVLTDVASGAL